MQRILSSAAVVFAGLCIAGCTSTPEARSESTPTLAEGAREVGAAVGTAAREVGQGAKKVGKTVAEAAKEGGRGFKEAIKGE